MDTLLNLVGPGDPFEGIVGGGGPGGEPLSAALAEGPFMRLVLLTPYGREERAEAICAAVPGLRGDLCVEVERFEAGDGDTAALVVRLTGMLESLTARKLLLPGRTGIVCTMAAPDAFGAWVLLRRGFLSGVPLLDLDLDPYPLPAPDDRASGEGTPVLREPPVSYGTCVEPSTSGATGDPDAIEVARRLGLCGEHPLLLEAVDTAGSVAVHTVPILVEGETGTGKSLFARLIHELSGRSAGPFVSVNCAALPERLVESTLFGHRKGAFTGAVDDQPGKFALADGGTLFLDEIGELPLELQPKLLKVLDDQVVEPLGARSGRRVDARVVVATNRDLRRDVAEGRFREDLYYRIAFGLVRLPPLRERSDDIPVIAQHLLARFNAALRVPKQLSPEALLHLQRQSWRGNVRDLENAIGRSVLMCRRDVLEPGDLLLDEGPGATDRAGLPEPHEAFSLEEYLAGTRRALILRALELASGNQSAAARKLGLSPQAVSRFMQREGL